MFIIPNLIAPKCTMSFNINFFNYYICCKCSYIFTIVFQFSNQYNFFLVFWEFKFIVWAKSVEWPLKTKRRPWPNYPQDPPLNLSGVSSSNHSTKRRYINCLRIVVLQDFVSHHVLHSAERLIQKVPLALVAFSLGHNLRLTIPSRMTASFFS